MSVVIFTPSKSCDVGMSGISSADKFFVRRVRARGGKIASNIISNTFHKRDMVRFSHGFISKEVRRMRRRNCAYESRRSRDTREAIERVDIERGQTMDIKRIFIQGFCRGNGVCQQSCGDCGGGGTSSRPASALGKSGRRAYDTCRQGIVRK